MKSYIEIETLCSLAKSAVPSIAHASTKQKNAVLLKLAQMLKEEEARIIEANLLDIAQAQINDLSDAMIDRLRLNNVRIDSICSSLHEIAMLDDPIGKGERWTCQNGLTISRTSVPLGVVAIIYEARPNVTIDAAALCIKSGNAVVLKGGKDAINTNLLLVEIIKGALTACEINPDVVGIIESTDRESTQYLMTLKQYIDVLIPRGGKGLIKYVSENSKIPVIETGAGNCHTFIDESAKLDMAHDIAINAKCSRPSVCNAMETLLVHSGIAASFLPVFAEKVKEYNVELRGCERSCILVPSMIPATEEDYATEYNDYILAVKVVGTLGEAINHINKYSTGHSEAIITQSISNAERFQNEINSAAVYVNASTRFTDGNEFGFGAEIGISTQKLHARGPMGLSALTTQKYLINGHGEIR